MVENRYRKLVSRWMSFYEIQKIINRRTEIDTTLTKTCKNNEKATKSNTRNYKKIVIFLSCRAELFHSSLVVSMLETSFLSFIR